MTFGWGVEDNETFAYRIAQGYPEAQFINTGKAAYSAKNLRMTAQSTPAKGYIYIPMYNDNIVSPFLQPTRSSPPLALRTYLGNSQRLGSTRHEAQDWQVDLSAMLSEGRWLILAMDKPSPVLDWLITEYPETVIVTTYTQSVSFADEHPSVNGHGELVDVMEPHVRTFVDDICNQ